MDRMRQFLEVLTDQKLLPGHLRGFFHVAIGRRLTAPDGEVISSGQTWRELAALLRESRVDPKLVTEIGADPETLSPRDRNRFWYAAIALAKPDTPDAVVEGEKFAKQLVKTGYKVGPSPVPVPASPPPAPAKKPSPPPPPPAPPKGKKK